MLNSRYDDLKSGKVKTIDGEEFFESLRLAKMNCLRAFVSMTSDEGFALHLLAAWDITEIWEYNAEDSPLAARRCR